MSRKKTTGKYETREELVRSVMLYYHDTDQNLTQVAKTTGISAVTLNNILHDYNRDGTPKKELAGTTDLDIARNKLCNFDVQASLEVVWEALHCFRDDCIPEGEEMYDAQWDDICTAMAWITESLDKPNED